MVRLSNGDVVLRAKHSPVLFVGQVLLEQNKRIRYHFRDLATGQTLAYYEKFFWLAFAHNKWELLQRSHPDALW